MVIVGFVGYGMIVGFNTALSNLAILTFDKLNNFNFAVLPLFLLMSAFVSNLYRINPSLAPAGIKTTLKEKLLAIRLTWPIVLLFLLVMGGIYGGVITPTEAYQPKKNRPGGGETRPGGGVHGGDGGESNSPSKRSCPEYTTSLVSRLISPD
jgi:hypothetical protein